MVTVLYDTDALSDLKTTFELRGTTLEKADKAPAPVNVKASIDTQIEKIKKASINVKSLMIAHKNFLLYDNENMITETYVSELNENIAIYGWIAFLGKSASKDNKLDLITRENKLRLNL